jgi:hypothetical protein
MGFKYCTSEFSWAKFYLIEHFDFVYRIMFAKRFKAQTGQNVITVCSELRIKIRKPFNLKIWKQKSVQFGFMIRPLINPLNICWNFGINPLIHIITLLHVELTRVSDSNKWLVSNVPTRHNFYSRYLVYKMTA